LRTKGKKHSIYWAKHCDLKTCW